MYNVHALRPEPAMTGLVAKEPKGCALWLQAVHQSCLWVLFIAIIANNVLPVLLLQLSQVPSLEPGGWF
jgi:hypothetical protein